MKLIDRLLNNTQLSGAFLSPDDGAGAGVSGEAPAPAAAETSAPAKGETENVESAPEADGDGKMFAMPSDEALFSLEEEDEPIPAKKPEPAAGKETPVAPAAAAPAAPKPGESAPQATPPAPAAAQPPAEGTPGAQVPPAQAQQPPVQQPVAQAHELPHETFLKALDAGKDQILPQLAAQYTISDEDAEKLGIVDKTVLSGLAANLHYGVMRATTQMLLQTLGPAVTQIMENNNKVEGFIGKFYKENPELDRATDHELVTQYATMYWQRNPNGNAADMIKQVGTMAKAHLGKLVATVAPPSGQTPPGVQPKKVPPKMQPSFTPAQGGGAAPAAKATPQQGDVWGALGDAMLRADDD